MSYTSAYVSVDRRRSPIGLHRLEKGWPACGDKGMGLERASRNAEAVIRRRKHPVDVGIELDRAVTAPDGDLGLQLCQGAAHLQHVRTSARHTSSATANTRGSRLRPGPTISQSRSTAVTPRTRSGRVCELSSNTAVTSQPARARSANRPPMPLTTSSAVRAMTVQCVASALGQCSGGVVCRTCCPT